MSHGVEKWGSGWKEVNWVLERFDIPLPVALQTPPSSSPGRVGPWPLTHWWATAAGRAGGAFGTSKNLPALARGRLCFWGWLGVLRAVGGEGVLSQTRIFGSWTAWESLKPLISLLRYIHTHLPLVSGLPMHPYRAPVRLEGVLHMGKLRQGDPSCACHIWDANRGRPFCGACKEGRLRGG